MRVLLNYNSMASLNSDNSGEIDFETRFAEIANIEFDEKVGPIVHPPSTVVGTLFQGVRRKFLSIPDTARLLRDYNRGSYTLEQIAEFSGVGAPDFSPTPRWYEYDFELRCARFGKKVIAANIGGLLLSTTFAYPLASDTTLSIIEREVTNTIHPASSVCFALGGLLADMVRRIYNAERVY